VVLHGETGTGKEVLARLLHEEGPRRGRRMVRVNCGAIPKDLLESTLFGHERGAFTGASQQQKGIFEEADGGTVFLDEIGELPLAAQAALLRVLESGTFCRVGSSREIAVDVRVVAATHRDMEAMVSSGAFRADLYYRLGGEVLEIPPLRARRDEVEPLAMRFLRMANEANGRSIEGFEPEALAAFAAYPWPGNVRELRNTVERAVVVARGASIGLADLPARIQARSGEPDHRPTGPIEEANRDTPLLALEETGPVREKLHGYEARMVREALEASGWNRSEAAKRLGIPARTLSYRMKVLGIRRPEPG
jgi:transcriptional regulator with GAF, ATPase, and Fis domain